jgi:hypothetical protein
MEGIARDHFLVLHVDLLLQSRAQYVAFPFLFAALSYMMYQATNLCVLVHVEEPISKG